MIAIHIDADREYAVVSAAARLAGDEFQLIQRNTPAMAKATGYWSTNDSDIEAYKNMDIPAYDSSVSRSGKAVDGDKPKPKKQRASTE